MNRLKLQYLFLSVFIVACWSLEARAQLTFDRPKTEPPLDNPYTLGVPREQILQSTREVLKTCAIQIDETLSKPSEGKIVTKPLVYSRGVTTRGDLDHLATMPAGEVRNWQQGRFYLEITALPLDGKKSQLLISAHIQGRLNDAAGGTQWIEGQSNGTLEDEVLRGLAGKILGIDLSLKGNNRRRILNCEY